MMTMLSIIIPVYNTPIDLLQRCFESIRYASELKIEVLVIDDGSSSHIGNFLKIYTAENEHFRYFYQKNTGAGGARNKGLEFAKGNYIMFVDSDDTVIPNSLSMKELSRDEDIIFFDGIIRERGKEREWKTFSVSNSQMVKKDFLFAALTGKLFSQCKKLFRSEFLKKNRLCFNTDLVVSGEDLTFVLKAVLCAEKMLYVEKKIYCYWHTWHGIEDRMCRYPEECVRMKRYSFDLDKEILGKISEFDKNEKEYILKYRTTRYIDSLFNSWASLYVLGKMDKNLKRLFLYEIDQIKIPMKEVTSNKVKAKYYLLQHHCWSIIKLLSLFRSAYLKFWARMKT